MQMVAENWVKILIDIVNEEDTSLEGYYSKPCSEIWHPPPHPKLENGSLEKIIKAVIADEDSRFNIQCLTLPLSISVNPPASFLFLFLKNLSQVNFQIPLQVSPFHHLKRDDMRLIFHVCDIFSPSE